MPAKAIPIIVAAVVATGVVIYQHREQILELVDRGREKLAHHLHKFADTLGGQRQAERPYGGHAYDEDDHRRRHEETEAFLRPREQTATRASGVASTDARLRQRVQVDHHDGQHHQASFGQNVIPLQNIHAPPPHEDDLPPPLPRRPLQSLPQPEQAPSESGYGSERTVLISPAINPQPSPLSQVTQAREPTGPSTDAIPVVAAAAAVVTGAALVGSQDSSSTIIERTPTEPIPVPSQPFSIHSSDDDGEPIPANPFGSNEQFRAIQEWATNTSHTASTPSTPTLASEAGSAPEDVPDLGDIMSEFGSASEGDLSEIWTEVGSQTSENDH